MNNERLMAYGFDALSYYFIPRWTTNYVARKLAESNLNKAIQDKCGAAGASNEADLKKQLAPSYYQDFFWTPRLKTTFPQVLPLIGGSRIPYFVPLLADPVLLWQLPGMTDNWWYKSGLIAFAGLGTLTSRGGLLLSNSPLRGLDPIQNGKYATALKDVTAKIECNAGPGGGNPEPVTDDSTQIVPAAADESTPVNQMVSSAKLSGIPVTDLNAQLAQAYGFGGASSSVKASLSQGSSVPGAKPVLPVVPLVTPAPLVVPQVRPIPVVRPMPILAR